MHNELELSEVKKKIGLSEPTAKDVDVTITSVFKGSPAPKGCVCFVSTLKWDKMIYTIKTPVNRSSITNQEQLMLIRKLKDNMIVAYNAKIKNKIKL